MQPNSGRAPLRCDTPRGAVRAQVRPSYSVHFSDGGPSPLRVGGCSSEEDGLKAMMEAEEPGSYLRMKGYMVAARANLRAGLPIFIREKLGVDECASEASCNAICCCFADVGARYCCYSTIMNISIAMLCKEVVLLYWCEGEMQLRAAKGNRVFSVGWRLCRPFYEQRFSGVISLSPHPCVTGL